MASGTYVVLLFVLTAVGFYLFVSALEREKGLSFQSDWGGLGGGLGGWRISRPVVYLVVTGLLLAMLTAAVSNERTKKNSADLAFLYLADRYMSALVAAQANNIKQIAISMEQSKLHLSGEAPSQKAINAVWDQIKQINPRYGDIWVDFKLPAAPAAGAEKK